MASLKLAKGETVKLFGPMFVTVKSGCLDIYGKLVCNGEKFVVHKARNYIATAIDTCELEVVMVDESQIQRVDDKDPYREKREIVEEIASRGFKRIMVVGCTDCGKTSFITLALNTLLARGIKPAVIDSDVGQADIGPPGFISLGYGVTPVYWINEIEPHRMIFIGDIKPQEHTWAIINGVTRLAEVAKSDGFQHILLDTDGWVRDRGAIEYKSNLVEAFKPDAIVVMGEDLKGLFARFSDFNMSVYEVNAPVHRRVRSREERRSLRSSRYREFLEGAPIVKVSLKDIIIRGIPLLYGLELDPATLTNCVDGKILYATRLFNYLNIYGSIKSYNSEELKKYNYERVKVYQYGSEKGLYCAVGQLGGFDYPCIIEKFDFEARNVLIRTKYTSKVEVLKVSKIKLSPDYIEEYVEV